MDYRYVSPSLVVIHVSGFIKVPLPAKNNRISSGKCAEHKYLSRQHLNQLYLQGNDVLLEREKRSDVSQVEI